MRRKSDYLARLETDERDLITTAEVAGFFAVTTRTVWAWVARGYFPPPKKIGPHVRRWSVVELQGWINDGCPPLEVVRDG